MTWRADYAQCRACQYAEDVLWHFYNPHLPDVEGDYVGVTGIQTFLDTMGALTGGTFKVEPLTITAVGDELVVMHNRNTMKLGDQPIATNVVVVWRIVNGRITEVWDIPSVYTTAEDG